MSSQSLLAMMFACLVVLPSASAQTDSENEARHQAILRATQALSSPRFREREQASRQLWQFGLPARSQLEIVARGSDPEARRRALNILRNFDYGILPSTPAIVRERIFLFRDGNAKQRSASFTALCESGASETLERLIALETKLVERERLLRQMFLSATIAEEYTDLSRVDAMIDRIGADQNEDWRAKSRALVLFSPGLLSVLAEAGKLDTVRKIATGGPPAHRAVFLNAMFANPSSLLTIVRFGGLDYVFAMLDLTDDPSLRDRLATQFTSHSGVIQSLVESGQLISFLDRVDERISPNVQQAMLLIVFRQPGVVPAMLREQGLDGLIAASKRVTSPEQRGAVLGRIMADPSVIAHLRSKDSIRRIVAFAEAEQDAKVRDAYLKALLQSKIFYNLRDDALRDMLPAIWNVVAASRDPSLKREALLRLSQGSTIASLVKDRDGVTQFMKMLGTLDAQGLASILPTIMRNEAVVKMFVQHKQFVELIEIVCRVNAPQRSQIIYQLFSYRNWAINKEPARSERLISTIAALESPNRMAFVLGISNTSLMRSNPSPKLVQAVAKAILDSPPSVANDALIALSHCQPVMQTLTKHEHRLWVVERMKVASPEAIYRIGNTIIGNSRYLSPYLKASVLDTLLDQTATMQPNHATSLLTRIMQSTTVAERLIVGGNLDRLLNVVSSLKNPQVRASAVMGLYSNRAAMPKLIEANRFDDLLKVASGHPDPLRRSEMLGALVSGAGVIEYLSGSDHADLIFAFTNPQWPLEQRCAFAGKVVYNAAATKAIVDADKLDALIDLARRQTLNGESSPLAAKMLASRLLLKPLIEADKMFEMIDATLLSKPLTRTYLYQMTRNEDAIDAFARADRLPDLIQLAVPRDGRGGSSYAHQLFSSSKLVQKLIAVKKIGLLYDLIHNETNANGRTQFLRSLLAYSQNSIQLVKAGELGTLVDMIQRYVEPRSQGSLFTSLLRNDTMTYLLESDRAGELFSIIESLHDVAVRQNLQTRMITRSKGVTQLVDGGHLARMIGWIRNIGDPATRGRCVAAIIAAGRIDILLHPDRISLLHATLESSALSQAMVSMLASKNSAIDALADHHLFEPLVQACDTSPQRIVLLAALLRNVVAIQMLDRKTQIDPWIAEFVDSDNRAARNQFLSTVISQPFLRRIVIENGHLGTLIDWVNTKQSTNPYYRRNEMLRLLDDPAAIEYLETEGRIALLFDLIQDESEPSHRYSLLSVLTQKPFMLEAVIRHESSEAIEAAIDSVRESYRKYLRDRVYLDNNSARMWIRAGKTDDLIRAIRKHHGTKISQFLSGFASGDGSAFADAKFLRAFDQMSQELDGNSRRSLRDRMVLNPGVRWHLLAGGNRETLLRWINESRNKEAALAPLLFSSSGAAAIAIHSGQLGDAERILVENSNDPTGPARLAAFYYRRGDLDQQIQKLKGLASLDADGRRQLIAFLRVAGRHVDAANLTEDWGETSDAAVYFALAGQWQDAARLQKQAVEQSNSDQRPQSGTIDNVPLGALVQLALYQHFGNQIEPLEDSIQSIRMVFQENESPHVRRQCGLALIQCGRIEEGLKFVLESDPLLYLSMRYSRYEYQQAMQEIQFDAENPSRWLNEFAIPAGTTDADWLRLQLGVSIAEGHVRCGMPLVASTIYLGLEDRIAKITSRSNRSKYRQHVARSMLRTGQIDECVRTIVDMGLKSSELVSNSQQVFDPAGHHRNDFSQWWNWLTNRLVQRKRSTTGQSYSYSQPWTVEDATQNLKTLADIFYSRGVIHLDGKPHTLDEFVREISGSGNTYYLNACVALLLRHHRYDQAKRLMDQQSWNVRNSIRSGDAETLLAVGNPLEAAERFRQRWARGRKSLDSLMQSELAAMTNEITTPEAISFDPATEINDKIRAASMMAVEPSERLALAIALAGSPFRAIARDELRLARRLVPPASQPWHQATSELLRLETDPRAKARLLEDLAWSRISIGQTIHAIEVPMQRHKYLAEAAIQTKRFDEAKRQIDSALRYSPASAGFGDKLIPLLQSAGQEELANDVYQTQTVAMRRVIDTCPRAADIHNNLAWLSARTGRDLDDALIHATEAVQLAPTNASFIDTLAETHFRNGNQQEAIQQIERALRLSPYDQHLLDQSKRFRSEAVSP